MWTKAYQYMFAKFPRRYLACKLTVDMHTEACAAVWAQDCIQATFE
jgi:hypothetical protein